jgi:hypothetical protein
MHARRGIRGAGGSPRARVREDVRRPGLPPHHESIAPRVGQSAPQEIAHEWRDAVSDDQEAQGLGLQSEVSLPSSVMNGSAWIAGTSSICTSTNRRNASSRHMTRTSGRSGDRRVDVNQFSWLSADPENDREHEVSVGSDSGYLMNGLPQFDSARRRSHTHPGDHVRLPPGNRR